MGKTKPKPKTCVGGRWRMFELIAGTSRKFWEIRCAGDTHTVRCGRIGSGGQEKRKTFGSSKAAQADAQRIIDQKLAKGYRELEVAGRQATPPRRQTKVKDVQSLPKLAWRDDTWEGHITLPAWHGFQGRPATYTSARSSRKSTGKVRLTIMTRESQRVEPTDEQVRALDYLSAHQEAIRDSVMKAVFRKFADLSEIYSYGEERFRPVLGLPKKFKNVDEMKPHLGLSTLYVFPIARSGIAHVGYGFHCDWEEEHGLGVMTHRRRVLDVGAEEIAFLDDAIQHEQRARRQAGKDPPLPIPDDLDVKDLNRAVIEGHRPWVKVLLDSGAIADKRYHGAGSATALDQAVSHRQKAILRLLLKHTKRPLNPALLASAVFQGDLAIIKTLVEHGIQPNEKNLTVAVTYRNPKIVRYLLDLGLRPTSKAIRRAAGFVEPSLVDAPRTPHRAILRMLKDAGAKPPDAKTEKVFASL